MPARKGGSRPSHQNQAEKVKSKIRELGSFKVIDKVTVKLNESRDAYEAPLSNLGIKNAEVPGHYVREFEKLLVGGIPITDSRLWLVRSLSTKSAWKLATS